MKFSCYFSLHLKVPVLKMIRVLKMNVLYAFGLLFLVVLVGLAIWTVIPKFLETPEYNVELSDKNFELRRYQSFIKTKVYTEGSQNQALRSGFRPLVRFIGAKERSSEKISMTVPVMQEQTQTDGKWAVSFSMPSKYSLDVIPRPASSNLKHELVPKKLMAVIQFSGRATEGLLRTKETELRNWLRDSNYKIIGFAHYYFYNDPITPGILRKNEVLFEVEQIGS